MAKKRDQHDALGPGAVGAWTDEELAKLELPHVSHEKATREDDDPEALREGTALANREETSVPPLEERGPITDHPSNRRGIHPGEEGERRGAEELDR